MIPHALAKGVWGNVLKNVEKTKIVPKMVKNHSFPHPPSFSPTGMIPHSPEGMVPHSLGGVKGNTW